MFEPIESVVTGLGAVSALGDDVAGLWSGLLAGRCGIAALDAAAYPNVRSAIGARVDGPRIDCFLERGNALIRRWPRTGVLGLCAALQAVADAGYDMEAAPSRVGLVVGTNLGNMSEMLDMHLRFQQHGQLMPRDAFASFHHFTACVISSVIDCRGPVQTLTTGCNAGMDAVGIADALIRRGDADAIIVVGTDSELHPAVFAGMEAAGAVATRFGDQPSRASRPFDIDRDGNVLGESAGALLIESRRHALTRGARVYAGVAGYASRGTGQARQYSPDHPDLDCAAAAATIRACLDSARWRAEDVDLYSANGSSSKRYDPVEAAAIQHVFGTAAQPPIFSMKGALGQQGAGTSSLQVVAACLSLASGDVPPTLNCDELDPACAPLNVLTAGARLEPRRVVTHAIGFGGFYYSALAVEKPEPTDGVRRPPRVRWSEATSRFAPTERLANARWEP